MNAARSAGASRPGWRLTGAWLCVAALLGGCGSGSPAGRCDAAADNAADALGAADSADGATSDAAPPPDGRGPGDGRGRADADAPLDGPGPTPDGGAEAADARGDDAGDAAPAPFEPFAYLTAPPDVHRRLCLEAADPAGAPDKVFITCDLEGAAFAPSEPPARTELSVVAYNLERGFTLEGQLAWLRETFPPSGPDVLLVSEADRGCRRTNERAIAHELAAALQLNYVFAVEFVELGEADGVQTAECEHGNAVLARYPIGNVRAIRHATQRTWYADESEPRLGGRIAIAADLRVGERLVRVYSVHFESAIEQTQRTAQAAEVASDGLTAAGPVIVGGDMNAGTYAIDLRLGSALDTTIPQFLERGYTDAHAGLSPAERVTAPERDFVLDYLFVRGADSREPGVCQTAACGALSDHYPVWATIVLPAE